MKTFDTKTLTFLALNMRSTESQRNAIEVLANQEEVVGNLYAAYVKRSLDQEACRPQLFNGEFPHARRIGVLYSLVDWHSALGSQLHPSVSPPGHANCPEIQTSPRASRKVKTEKAHKSLTF